jgi:ribosomal protein S18 acetylase RimI-like enzyme
MDGIVVHPAARGQGVGTLLLHALFDIAQQQQMRTVRLDVVDTNPAARRLYERLGFVAVKSRRYPLLRTIFGFSASTTMIAQVNRLSAYRQPVYSPQPKQLLVTRQFEGIGQ